jgi:hypothetical protein
LQDAVILFYFICGEIFAILQKGILNFFLKKNCHLYTVFLEKKSPKYEFLNFLKKITQNHKQFPTIMEGSLRFSYFHILNVAKFGKIYVRLNNIICGFNKKWKHSKFCML